MHRSRCRLNGRGKWLLKKIHLFHKQYVRITAASLQSNEHTESGDYLKSSDNIHDNDKFTDECNCSLIRNPGRQCGEMIFICHITMHMYIVRPSMQVSSIAYDTIAYNNSLRYVTTNLLIGYFLQIWKCAEIILLQKPSKNPRSPSSYRPITLLLSAN
uniref:Uncharacterized protein n=1 Tax=Vespula pensylvanica TaxID=30213 RepID=A0A834N823_VESPE|nr:hypothetical protein H0235_016337 [Vespula pensylvanica]